MNDDIQIVIKDEEMLTVLLNRLIPVSYTHLTLPTT